MFDPTARASSKGSAGIRVQFAASSSFRLERLDTTAEGIPVASYRDLCAGKLQAVVGRFEPRDFIDLHAIMMRPDQAATLPTEPTMRERVRALVRDVMQCDPGFDLPYIGRGLSRRVDRPLVSAFPLRIFTPMAEADVQRTLRTCVDEIAVMIVS